MNAAEDEDEDEDEDEEEEEDEDEDEDEEERGFRERRRVVELGRVGFGSTYIY